MKSNVWSEILDPALMDVEGGALFIGTPKGKNHFYSLFMSAMDGKDDWEAFHFSSDDNPFLKRKELERMRNDDTRSLEIVKQEIDASFVSGGGKVLKPSWFKTVTTLPSGRVKHDVIDPELGMGMGNTIVRSSQTYDAGHFYVTVDLAGFSRNERRVERLDETVIAITYVTQGGWWVVEVQHGHWDSREVALRIVRTCSQYPGCRLGIEKGALMNAIGPYLEDEMRRFNRYVTVEPLTHGGTKKLDRIVHALQGRAQRGRIMLLDDACRVSKARKDEPWVQHFLDQAADFPDPLSHDDLLDAVAYVDQMATVSYVTDVDMEEWEPLDIDSGY